MSQVITTLKKKGDISVDIYPNIKAENIPNNAIDENKIQDASISYNKLQANSVRNDNIINYAVTEGKIADNSISNGKIQDNAIDYYKLNKKLMMYHFNIIATIGSSTISFMVDLPLAMNGEYTPINSIDFLWDALYSQFNGTFFGFIYTYTNLTLDSNVLSFSDENNIEIQADNDTYNFTKSAITISNQSFKRMF